MKVVSDLKKSTCFVMMATRRPLVGSFRVEMLGSQESLDLDCGKFFTVRTPLCSLLPSFPPSRHVRSTLTHSHTLERADLFP